MKRNVRRIVSISTRFVTIFLFLANFIEEIDFRNCFAILLLSSLIDFNNVDLFKNDLEDRIDKKSLSSFEAKTFIT